MMPAATTTATSSSSPALEALPPGAEAPHAALMALARPEKAAVLAGFFKTGKGQYGEGDRFLGIAVPEIRGVARQFVTLPLPACQALLDSPYNEERLLGLLILVARYRKGDAAVRQQVHAAYLGKLDRVNNWNLVDSSAPYIVGPQLRDADRGILYTWARSDSLWERRIAVLATLAFIRDKDYRDTLALTELLMDDPQDLMHKACGWMLREIGKRDAPVLEAFLRQHQGHMPRTMLRYAIERCPPDVRRAAMAGTL